MTEQQGLPERLGRTINELDIDFGRFSLAGWIVSTVSLGTGAVLAYLVYTWVPARGGDGRGTALSTGLTLLFVTVGLFLFLRWALGILGIAVVRPVEPQASIGDNSSRRSHRSSP